MHGEAIASGIYGTRIIRLGSGDRDLKS